MGCTDKDYNIILYHDILKPQLVPHPMCQAVPTENLTFSWYILTTGSVSVLLGTGPVYYYTLLVLVHNPIVVEDRHCAYL